MGISSASRIVSNEKGTNAQPRPRWNLLWNSALEFHPETGPLINQSQCNLDNILTGYGSPGLPMKTKRSQKRGKSFHEHGNSQGERSEDEKEEIDADDTEIAIEDERLEEHRRPQHVRRF